MSKAEHQQNLGIPDGHSLVESKPSEWGVRKGQDTDTYYYDHIDAAGVLIAKYEVKDSTSIYPPFNRTVTHRKVE